MKNNNIEFQDSATFVCEGYMWGKPNRLEFKSSDNWASQPGELVHSDVCGPMQQDSIGGSRYFLLFKDDFSHFRVVYFMKEKSEVSGIPEIV